MTRPEAGWLILSFCLIFVGAEVVTHAENSEPSLFEKYQALFAKYPAIQGSTPKKCHPLDFETNGAAKKYHTRLAEGVKLVPNFDRKFILFGSPTSGGQDYFIAECGTGKIFSTQFSSGGGVLARLESSLLIFNPPNPPDTVETFGHSAFGIPALYLWKPKKGAHGVNTLQPIADPIWPPR